MTELSSELSAPSAQTEAVETEQPKPARTRSRTRNRSKRITNKAIQPAPKNPPAKPAGGRVSISDLPPDRQAEIAGRHLADAAQRKHVYRPQVPEIVQDAELHTHEVSLLFTRDFAACNEYAVAIDYVARERLTSRAEFNNYLNEFQEALDELSGVLVKLHEQYEKVSNGGKANSRKPLIVEVAVQSNRSFQLLELYKSADDILRMVQFLMIYGDLRLEEASKTVIKVEQALVVCTRALRNVKVRCFKRIVEVERLTLPVESGTTIGELKDARRIAAIKSGYKAKDVRPPRRKKAARPVLDPSAPVTALLVPPAAEAE